MTRALWIRAGLTWALLLALAILNGAFRTAALLPRLPQIRAHQVSTLLLAVLILAATRALAGHFLFDRPWAALLAEHDLAGGRLWILIPVVTSIAPVLWLHSPRNERGPRAAERGGPLPH